MKKTLTIFALTLAATFATTTEVKAQYNSQYSSPSGGERIMNIILIKGGIFLAIAVTGAIADSFD